MARTVVGVNDPKAVKKYSVALAVDSSAQSYWTQRFLGKGENARTPLQVLTDLESDSGEEIRYDLLAEMRMAPVLGDDILEGKEERLRFYTDSVYIDQVRCGANGGGRMTRKRTLHNMRERARERQANWWARFMDEMHFIYLSGARGVNDNFIAVMDEQGYANNPLQAPTANHHFFAGNATAFNNLTAADTMTLGLVDKLFSRAATQGGGATDVPVMQPCMVDGEEHYVLVMHTWQEDALRKETGAAGWMDLQKAAATALGRNSPIFKGGLGMYRNVILHSHRNVIRFNNAGAGNNVNAARALFLGSQAGVVAFGSPGTGLRFDWHEEMRDNGNQLVITSSSIVGVKKTRFTTESGEHDHGVFALDTAVTPA